MYYYETPMQPVVPSAPMVVVRPGMSDFGGSGFGGSSNTMFIVLGVGMLALIGFGMYMAYQRQKHMTPGQILAEDAIGAAERLLA
jgi:LPXTG-motif cell wall-anchored protein